MGLQCRIARTHVSRVDVQLFGKYCHVVSDLLMCLNHTDVALAVNISSIDVSKGQQRMSTDAGVRKLVISVPCTENAREGSRWMLLPSISTNARMRSALQAVLLLPGGSSLPGRKPAVVIPFA